MAPSKGKDDGSAEASGASSAKEKQAIQQLLGDARKIVVPLQSMASVKPGTADALDRLENAIAKLPSSKALADELEKLRSQAKTVLAECRRARTEGFGKLEKEFIAGARAAGESVRELAEGWRVGPLEIQAKRANAQCRALYNREQVVPWAKVADVQDLRRLYQKAMESLERVAIPESSLGSIFAEAYDEASRRRPKAIATSDGRVALRNFYPELRLALIRSDLQRKPDGQSTYSDFPLWAFLYNLDRYRQLVRTDRLVLQTGSQEETRRLGCVVGGLDAKQDYTQVCFILRS